jgi:hypothetical protein
MSYLIDVYPNIIVDRKGSSKDSYMKTISIIDEILCGLSYKVTINGTELLLRSNPVYSISEIIYIPKYLEFFGEWQSDRKIQMDHKDANILGEFGKFEIDLNQMIVPIQCATIENLAYYNVKLLKINDGINFETTDNLPLCIVDVGTNYIKDYILHPNYGGGVYLEYHKNPHFHMPIFLESDGGIMLAKKIDGNKYHISCFRIPFGYATYIPPYVLHNDCFLTGQYYVVYSISEPFSTCLLRNKENKIINVSLE